MLGYRKASCFGKITHCHNPAVVKGRWQSKPGVQPRGAEAGKKSLLEVLEGVGGILPAEYGDVRRAPGFARRR